MDDSHYSLLCALLLGLGQLCIFTGYDTQCFVVEPVLSFVSGHGSSIDEHAGYNGLAIVSIFFTIANLLAPTALNILGSKLSLVVGSLLFTLYLCSFFYIHWAFFYTTCALVGVGFALFYAGHSVYITEHSSRETIERNSALVWAIGTGCMVVGGVVMLITTRLSSQAQQPSSSTPHPSTAAASQTEDRSYREFSNSEIRYLYGTFALFSFASNIILAALPKSAVRNSLAEVAGKARTPFGQQIKLMGRAMAETKMLALTPLFCLVGGTFNLWTVIYPTTLSYTKKLAGESNLPAYYSIALGVGEILMSIVISLLSKRIRNFGQKPTIAIGVGLMSVALALILAATPAMSSIRKTDDPTLLIEPCIAISLVIAVLLGCADACLNTCRTIICAIVLPDQRAEAFSISKFYQSLTAAILFFAAKLLPVPVFACFLFANCVIATILFFMVANSIRVMERKARVGVSATAASDLGPAHYDNAVCK